MIKKITLTCKSIWYYSSFDEDAFFEWVKKMPFIIKYDGKGDELYLYIKSKKLKEDDLTQLLALFYRYKIDMKQLAIFLNETNKAWFYENPKAYWYKKVFGLSIK